MTTTDDRIAELEARPDCEESLRERVARAIAESDGEVWDTPPTDWHGDYLINAGAAIRVITTRVEGAPAAPDPAAAGPMMSGRVRDRATRDRLAEALADELGRHGDIMSREWSDNDADPVTITLGCRCGFVRGVVTAAEMAADLPGFIRAHRLHVAAALLASGAVAELVREGQAEALDDAAVWVWEQDEPWAEVWHELRDRAADLRAPRTGGAT